MPRRLHVNVLVFREKRKPNVGERIAVYWKDDHRFYTGHVHTVEQNASFVIHYDDGETETLDLDKQIWEYAHDRSRYKSVPPKEYEATSESDQEAEGNHGEDNNNTESEEEGREQNHPEDVHLPVQNDNNTGAAQPVQQETEMEAGLHTMRESAVTLSQSAREAQETNNSAQNTEASSTGLENFPAGTSTPNNGTSQARFRNNTRASAPVDGEQSGPVTRSRSVRKNKRNKVQASAAGQEGNERKKQKTQKVRKAQQTQHAQQTQDEQHMPHEQQVEEQQRAEDQQQAENLQQIQGTHSEQHEQGEQMTQILQHTPGRDRSRRVTRPLLVGDLPPVKRYVCIRRLRERGHKSEDLMKEMPYEELRRSFRRSHD